MHAYVIAGGTKDSRQKTLGDMLVNWIVSAADQVRIHPDGLTIGIGEIRDFEKRLALSPLSGTHTVGIIENAETLTIEAQQALLKTLEEPPPHAYIICELQNSQYLLTTIQSRCQIIQLPNLSDLQISSTLYKEMMTLRNCSVGVRLKNIADTIKTRNDAKEWIETIITSLTIAMKQEFEKETPHYGEITFLVSALRSGLDTQSLLLANTSPKLAVDLFLLSL